MKIINKKNGLLLVGILTIILQLNGQISINNTDMPAPDDIVRTSIGLNLDFIDYQETGENYSWDFSQLIPISQSMDTFVGLMEVPLIYLFVFSNSSNLVNEKNNSIPIPDFPITNTYTFFNNTANYFGIAGDGFTLSGIPIPLEFGSPDKLYRFPMNYGNIGDSYAEYSLGLQGFGYISKEISRSNIVDGWGTLTTPYGTFEVLRQKSEVVEFDSLYVDSIGIGLPIYREYTEYSWLGKGQKIPLLKITSGFGGLIVTYIDSVRVMPSGVANQLDQIFDDFRIFPVPTHDVINISFELHSVSDIEISIYNPIGNRVVNKNLINIMPGDVSLKLSTRKFGLQDGIYLVNIISNNQQITKKLILY